MSRAPHSVSRLRVRYAETDQMGVVYHANYLVWFEVGRTDLLRTLGWTYKEMEAAGFWLPVTEATCRYHRPARYDDDLEVRTRGTLLSGVRLAFDYVIARGDEHVVTGRTVHASLNRQGRPVRLPERIRSLFA